MRKHEWNNNKTCYTWLVIHGWSSASERNRKSTSVAENVPSHWLVFLHMRKSRLVLQGNLSSGWDNLLVVSYYIQTNLILIKKVWYKDYGYNEVFWLSKEPWDRSFLVCKKYLVVKKLMAICSTLLHKEFNVELHIIISYLNALFKALNEILDKWLNKSTKCKFWVTLSLLGAVFEKQKWWHYLII